MYPSRKFNLAEEILPIVNLPQLVPVRRLVLGALTFFLVGVLSTFLVASRDQLECEEKTCEFCQRFLGFSSSMRRFSAHKLHVKMVQDFIVRSGKNHVTLYKLKVSAPGVAFDLFPKEERSDAPHLVATQAALQRVAKGSGEHFMYRSPLSVVHKTVLLFTLAISLYGIYLAYWVTRRWNEASAPVPPRVGITSEEKYLSELIELAQSALDRKDFSQALRYGKQSLIATKDSSVRAEALSILAQAQLGLGKLSEASELLARAQQVDSNLKIDSRVLDAVRYAPPLPKSSGSRR